jgi:hypothetical protein
LSDPKFSDLTIVCGAKRYPVHRVLLATRSSFFAGACRNSFIEAETGVINLSEDDADAVEHMVHCEHDNNKTQPCAKTNPHYSRLLPHGLSEEDAISSFFAAIITPNFADVATLLEAWPA